MNPSQGLNRNLIFSWHEVISLFGNIFPSHFILWRRHNGPIQRLRSSSSVGHCKIVVVVVVIVVVVGVGVGVGVVVNGQEEEEELVRTKIIQS